MSARLEAALTSAWHGLVVAWLWGALEVALHPGPQPARQLWAALALTGAVGVGFGLAGGLLAGWGLGRRPRALVLLVVPLVGFVGELAWAFERASELSEWPGRVGTWGVALAGGALAAWGVHRILRAKLLPSRTIFLAVAAALLVCAVLLEPAQRFHESLGQMAPWAALGAALILWTSGVAERLVLPASAVLVGVLQQLIPNPYYALQTAAALWTLALSYLALECLRAETPRLAPSSKGRRNLRSVLLFLPVVALPVFASTAHVLIRDDAASWRALCSTRGIMSALVRLGHTLTDFDRDGHGAVFAQADCAPFDARAYPGLHEIPGNGLDDDCVAGDPGDVGPWIRELEALHEPPPAHGGDVVLVVVDTLRFDDAHADASAAFTELRQRGVSFERAYASSSMTAMSMMSVLGGVPAGSIPLDASDFSYVPLQPPPTLAAHLASAGYDTAFVGGAVPEDNRLFTERTYARGAAHLRPTSMSEHPERVTDLALTTWRTLTGPRFLYVHYMWAHWPETDHQAYRRRVRDVDHALSRLMHEIGFDALWVVTADHGEEFGEHGGAHHALTLYDEVLHVPLVVAHPGIEGGRSENSVTSLRSIMPTVLAAARPDQWSHADSSKGPYLCLRGRDCRDMVVPIALERRGLHLHGLIRGDFKVIRDIERDHIVAFDRSADPEEQSPLRPVPAELLVELVRAEQHIFGPRSPCLFWPYEPGPPGSECAQ